MKILTWLSRKRFPFDPLISVRISRRRLLHNLAAFSGMAPKTKEYPYGAIAPVLKSNAYGHSLAKVAEILDLYRKEKKLEDVDIPFFVVDSYFEAVNLRANGIKTPLLVIGYVRPENIIGSRLKNVSFAMTSMDTLQYLEKNADTEIYLHLKIDTGMHRQGILPEEIDGATEILKNNQRLVLEGICSHLPDADNPENTKDATSFTKQQIGQWNNIVKRFKSAFPSIKYVHLSNTDGHRFAPDIEANVSRLGIGLYGICGNQELLKKTVLEPVLEMRTVITSVKHLRRGETVGYNNTFVAPHDMLIATIPGGYYEGVDRRLSSEGNAANGIMLTGTERIECPVIGRVSMNITTIDVSSVKNPTVGMPVIMVSDRLSDGNSIVSIAKKCGTIPYEIAVHIPGHLRRVIID